MTTGGIANSQARTARRTDSGSVSVLKNPRAIALAILCASGLGWYGEFDMLREMSIGTSAMGDLHRKCWLIPAQGLL